MNITLVSLTGAGFVLVTIGSYTWFFRVLRASIAKTDWSEEKKRSIANRFLLTVCVWGAAVLSVAATGLFADFSMFPPRFGIVLLTPMVIVLFTLFSKPVNELLPHLPTKDLLNIQVFRIPVELLLWAAFVTGMVPEQMTFEGRNFDVLTGLAAPAVAHFFVRNRTIVYLYNLATLALLVNIVSIAFLSLPTPLRVFMNEPSSVMVSQFPVIILPAMLVPLAYGLSFLSLRQLSVVGRPGVSENP